MSDQSSSEDESPQETKLRISFILSPSIRSTTQRDLLGLPSEPIAVPASIRKRGLSAVVNHLLDRRVPKEDNAEEDSDSDEDDENKLPAIPFDFILNDKLLRLPLESAVRKEGLSTEHALEIQYFPARLPPKKEGESDVLPDWINVMDYNTAATVGNNNGTGGGVLFTGGADGIIRTFHSSTNSTNGNKNKGIQQKVAVSAHTAPIKCLSTSSLLNNGDGKCVVATGSMDQTLITHMYNPTNGTLDLHAVYTGGHTNSIGSVALLNSNTQNDDKMLMASGDWDGGLSIWSVPTSTAVGASSSTDGENSESKSKKQKGSKGSVATTNNANIHEIKPLQSIKAHSSNISGVSWGYNNTHTILTGSWDHGLKVYDVNRMDCILALNGSRVVTSLDRCSNSNVVATSCPDCTVRLWDMRTSGEGSSSISGSGMDKSLKQSHKSWVSNVKWSGTDPFVLGSTSHDGTLKVWDIRSSLPLHTVKVVNGKKGDGKALCLAFGNDVIYSGGSDCIVKQFWL